MINSLFLSRECIKTILVAYFRMPFKYLDDIATADIAVEISADNLPGLLQEAAMAVFDSLADTGKVAPKIRKEIRLVNREVDVLLFDWLAEIIFLKDRDEMIFSKAEVEIIGNAPYSLEGTIWGEQIDLEKHELRNDVKAVTFHQFKVEQQDGKWKAFVILDI